MGLDSYSMNFISTALFIKLLIVSILDPESRSISRKERTIHDSGQDLFSFRYATNPATSKSNIIRLELRCLIIRFHLDNSFWLDIQPLCPVLKSSTQKSYSIFNSVLSISTVNWIMTESPINVKTYQDKLPIRWYSMIKNGIVFI